MRRKTRLISVAISMLFSASASASADCNSINLGSQPHLEGLEFTQALIKKLNRDSQLSFKPVFLETTDPKKHLQVMQTNPHFKNDVSVCRDHQVLVYVGVYPYFPVEKYTEKPVPAVASFLPDARDPEKMLTVDTINFTRICRNGDSPITPEMPVLEQVPKAGQSFRFYFQGNRPKQEFARQSEVLLYVDCAQKQCTKSDCPPESVPAPLPTDNSLSTQYSVVHLTSAAAGGATLAYFLSVGALGAAMPAPKAQSPVSARMLSVRVRAVADIP